MCPEHLLIPLNTRIYIYTLTKFKLYRNSSLATMLRDCSLQTSFSPSLMKKTSMWMIILIEKIVDTGVTLLAIEAPKILSFTERYYMGGIISERNDFLIFIKIREAVSLLSEQTDTLRCYKTLLHQHYRASQVQPRNLAPKRPISYDSIAAVWSFWTKKC